jgi:hypothetical protein
MPAFDKVKSKIKMTALTKHGYENEVWFCYLTDNKKPVNRIISEMKNRFEKTGIYLVTNVIQFYDNYTNQLIVEYKK